jgi:tetratricopeptide (TPR) repeat protein
MLPAGAGFMSVRIFLSTVSDEFRDYRDQLRHDLTRPNVEVKVQEDFKNLGMATLGELDLYITNCDAVVHLVGDMTGARAGPRSTRSMLAKYRDLPDTLPPLRQPLAAGLAISYTQWEAWLALYHDKLLVIAKADDAAPRGPNYAPTDDSRAAQQEHLARLAAVEHYPRGTFTSANDLAKQVLSSAILDLLAAELARQLVAASQTQAAPGHERAVGAAVTNIATGAAAGDTRLQHALDLLETGNIEDASKLLRTVADENAATIAQAQARIREDSGQAATAWRNLGAIAGLRDPKSAREAYARAVTLDPEDTESLYWDGWFQLAARDLGAAERSYRQLLALRQTEPDSRDAFWARLGLGDIERARGRLSASLADYRAARASAEGVAKAGPENAGWQRDLSVSYNKIGEVLVVQGNLPEALKSFRDGLAIRDRLAKADPTNADWQRNLSVSYNRIGEVLVAQGKLPEALQSFRDGFAIRDRLAKADPGNAGWQRDLSLSYNRIGDVLMAQGNLPEALKSLRDGLAIADRLAKADPGNAVWQRDLSVSYNRIGDVLAAQSNLPEAMKSFRDGLAIADRLAKGDPDNADWQHNLSVSYLKLAGAFRKVGDNAMAFDALRRGRAIMLQMTSLSPGNAEWKRDLARFDEQIAELAR